MPAESVRAEQALQQLRLVRPAPAGIEGIRNMRVVVARSARKTDRGVQSARKAVRVATRIAEHAARDRPVRREAVREENRSVRVPVERRLAEVEDDDAADAALRRAAALPAEHV